MLALDPVEGTLFPQVQSVHISAVIPLVKDLDKTLNKHIDDMHILTIKNRNVKLTSTSI